MYRYTVVAKRAVPLIIKLKHSSTVVRVLDKNMLVRLKRTVPSMLKQKGDWMSDRLRIFGIVALLGFMAGVIAQVTAEYIIPWLMVVLPSLINIKWVVSGFAGAALTLVLVTVWAYVTGNRSKM